MRVRSQLFPLGFVVVILAIVRSILILGKIHGIFPPLLDETSLVSSAASQVSRNEYWTTALNRTVLAYPIDKWEPENLHWPLRNLDLKVFVYDTSLWPTEIGGVQDCRLRQYLNASKQPFPSNDNRIADIGIIQLFQTYPGRVYDPQEADVFVVPYPHASHCFTDECRAGPYQPNCGGVPQSLIKNLVDDCLTFFQGHDIDRHLFILSTSHMLNRKLQMAALKFVIGGRIYKLDTASQKYLPRMNPRFKSNPKQLGTFIIPYLNTHPWMQPTMIRSRPVEWWTRPRKYSFSFVFGTRNQKATSDPRIYRRQFKRHVQHAGNGTLGGLPYVLVSNPESLTPEAMLTLYQESTFCPCLPGDTVTQKRFFDAILSGCLPVVLQFTHESYDSWHPFDNSKLDNTVPFAHPLQYGPDLLVNYSEFVVEADSPKTITQSMMKILNDPEELHRRQVAMSHVAPLMTYGLGPKNAHRYDDAFARLLRGLKYYLDTKLPPREK